MSEYKRYEYKIVPTESYEMIRNCSQCNCKTNYVNTNHFRVNANGEHLDVWLIYQCEKCKHTYNLPIFERVKPEYINKKLYQKFLSNDRGLAFKYGCDRKYFTKHKIIIDENKLSYDLVLVKEEIRNSDQDINEEYTIQNPYGLRIRMDKVLAQIMKRSRSEVKNKIQEGTIFRKDECSTEQKVNVGTCSYCFAI